MKRIFINLGLSLAVICFCLLCLEISFRFFQTQKAPLTRHDRPGYYYTPTPAARDVDYRYTREKPPGVFRIAVIGDSFTYPTLMQFDDSFSKRLERLLNLSQERNSPKAEVINFGKQGLSTEQEVEVLKLALSFQPDLVLLEITLNDLTGVDFATAQRTHAGRYIAGNLQLTPKDHPILSRWKSLGFLAQRIHASRTLPSTIRYYHDIYNDQNWAHFSHALKSMKELTSSHNTKLAAVLFPLFYTVIDEKYPFQDLHDRINKQLDSTEIPHLDLRDSFQNMVPERLQVLPGGDTHPNEIAHRIAADTIYDWFEKSSFIPENLKARRTDRIAKRYRRHRAKKAS